MYGGRLLDSAGGEGVLTTAEATGAAAELTPYYSVEGPPTVRKSEVTEDSGLGDQRDRCEGGTPRPTSPHSVACSHELSSGACT